jgi:uncharacterized RDD family membrane protein YckC
MPSTQPLNTLPPAAVARWVARILSVPILTLAAVAIAAVANWRVLAFRGTLIPIAAAMFVASWWLTGNWFHRNSPGRLVGDPSPPHA